jgi:2-keto-3-deoxy-L-rhamnonate aldolase RhmA
VPGLDCLFMGPVDLSNDLGMIRRHGFPDCIGAPEFQVMAERQPPQAGVQVPALRSM